MQAINNDEYNWSNKYFLQSSSEFLKVWKNEYHWQIYGKTIDSVDAHLSVRSEPGLGGRHDPNFSVIAI